MTTQKLTEKQKMFCLEYLKDLNGTQAAIRAGYSAKTANRIASENLSKPVVISFLRGSMDKRVVRCEITADMVLKEYAKVAFIDIREFYTESGQLKSPHELSDAAAASLSGIDVDEIWGYDMLTEGNIKQGETKKIKMHNKLAALDALGKHIGLFKADNEQQKQITTPQINVSFNGKKISGKLA